jgi:hypothetical protein
MKDKMGVPAKKPLEDELHKISFSFRVIYNEIKPCLKNREPGYRALSEKK